MQTFSAIYFIVYRRVARETAGELAKRTDGHPLPQDARLSFCFFSSFNRLSAWSDSGADSDPIALADLIRRAPNRPDEINRSPHYSAGRRGALEERKIGAARSGEGRRAVSPFDRFVQGYRVTQPADNNRTKLRGTRESARTRFYASRYSTLYNLSINNIERTPDSFLKYFIRARYNLEPLSLLNRIWATLERRAENRYLDIVYSFHDTRCVYVLSR